MQEKTTHLTVGEMAKLNDVSKKTLYLYEKKRLLIPCAIESETGFRHYSLSQCATLDFIQRMKMLRFSLDEIKSLLDQADPDLLETQINAHLLNIEEELTQLDLAKKMGESLLRNSKLHQNHPNSNEINYETLPKRRILRLCPIGPNTPGQPSSEIFDNWERTIAQCKKILIEKSYPAPLFGCICDMIQIDRFKEGLICGDAVVFIDERFKDLYSEAENIPAGLYATLYYDKWTSENGLYTEPFHIKNMLDDIEAKSYFVIGDYIGEPIVETPVFCRDRRDMFCRLQIPIARK